MHTDEFSDVRLTICCGAKIFDETFSKRENHEFHSDVYNEQSRLFAVALVGNFRFKFNFSLKMPSLNSLKTVSVKLQEVATPQNKMSFLNWLIKMHKVKRFSKSKAEPVFQVFRKHPITRGMASYLLIWPVGNIIQQTLSDQEKFDVWKIIRFGLYGCFITAPSLYGNIFLAI